MEKGFGGPVWHASVMVDGVQGVAEHLALKALEGVGDASLGEWRERHKASHVRRRLSAQEVEASKLFMVDMRATVEGKKRLHKMMEQFPRLRNFALEELSDRPRTGMTC